MYLERDKDACFIDVVNETKIAPTSRRNTYIYKSNALHTTRKLHHGSAWIRSKSEERHSNDRLRQQHAPAKDSLNKNKRSLAVNGRLLPHSASETFDCIFRCARRWSRAVNSHGFVV